MTRNKILSASLAFSVVALSASLTTAVLADGFPVVDNQPEEGSQAAAPPAGPSGNYNKDRQFLPGEEVVTPTGQKLKVWSTEGPVSVSKAPDPFADPQRSGLPGDTHIIVDEALIRDQLGAGGGAGNSSGSSTGGSTGIPHGGAAGGVGGRGGRGQDTFIATPSLRGR